MKGLIPVVMTFPRKSAKTCKKAPAICVLKVESQNPPIKE